MNEREQMLEILRQRQEQYKNSTPGNYDLDVNNLKTNDNKTNNNIGKSVNNQNEIKNHQNQNIDNLEDIIVYDEVNLDYLHINKTHVEFVCKKEDFEILSKYADYSSILTMVISLSKNKINYVKLNSPGVLDKYFKVEEIYKDVKKPMLMYNQDKDVFYIDNFSVEILSFLEIWTEVNPVVKYASFPRLFMLLEQNLIDVSEDAEKRLSYLTKNDNIEELISSNMRTKHLNKNFSFKNECGKDKIKSLEFDKVKMVKNKVFILKDLIVKEFDGDNKKAILINPEKGSKYIAQFYKYSASIKRSMLPGREVSLMVTKVLGDFDNGYRITEPIIVPNGFKLSHIEYAKCHRKYPSANYNAILSEYNYRKQYKNKK